MLAPTTNRHPEDVKADVRKTGLSLAELATHNGLAVSTLQAAIHRPQPSGNRAIARHLGKSLHEIWPEWFDGDGNRISRPEHNPKTADAASQNRRAG